MSAYFNEGFFFFFQKASFPFLQWFSYNLFVLLNCYYYNYSAIQSCIYTVWQQSHRYLFFYMSMFQTYDGSYIFSSLVFFFSKLLQFSSMLTSIHYQHNLDTVVQCSINLTTLTCRTLFIILSSKISNFQLLCPSKNN